MNSPRQTSRDAATAGEFDIGNARDEGPVLSLIVPVYDEQATLAEFHRRVTSVLEQLEVNWEIVYVDDGSRDSSAAILDSLHASEPRVSVVRLSRNFGKEVALSAGLDYAIGRAVVLMDADLQHPPEVIPQLVARWRDGFDVVCAVRTERGGESLLRRKSSSWFYTLLARVSDVPIPHDAGDFRILSHRAAQALRQVRERHRFMKGLYAWIGFPQAAIEYRQEPRFAGVSKWNYWKLWNFALEGVTSFTTLPLRIASYVGLGLSITALAFASWIIIKTLLFGDPVAGYPSLMVVILLLGGVQLAALGVIGEYLGRTFDEAKRRPLYLVELYRPGRVVEHRQSSDSAIRANGGDAG